MSSASQWPAKNNFQKSVNNSYEIRKKQNKTNKTSNFYFLPMKAWKTFENVYLKSVAFLLLMTGAVKLISASQKAPALAVFDPLIRFMSIKQTSIIAGIIEVAVAFYIFKSSNVTRQLEMVVWLSLLFIAYRVGLYLIQFHGVCPCLGNANSWLKLSDNSINNLTLGLLVYLSVGSILTLGIRRFQTQRQNQERV